MKLNPIAREMLRKLVFLNTMIALAYFMFIYKSELEDMATECHLLLLKHRPLLKLYKELVK